MIDIKLGKFKITVCSSCVSKAFDLILNHSLSYETFKFKNNGDAIITVSSDLRDKYLNLFDQYGIEAHFGTNYGLGALINKYKRRYGILVGIILMLLTVHFSSRFVWDINIEGNKEVSDDDI